jgi:signal transduction histidine kinase
MPLAFLFPSCHATQIIPLLKWCVMLIGLAVIVSCKRQEQVSAEVSPRTHRIIDHANTLLYKGEVQHAVLYLDSAYRVFPVHGPADLYEKYSFKVGYYLHNVYDTAKASRYADSLFYILKATPAFTKSKYVEAVFTKGDALMAERKYTEAFKCYYDGKSFAKSNLGSCNLSNFSYKLALVRYNQGQYQKAIPYIRLALAENSHCKPGSDFGNNFFAPQNYLNTAALCFERSGIPDSAIFYYQRDLGFIAAHAAEYPGNAQFMETARGVVYGNLGGVYSTQGNYSEARKYLTESIRINDRPNYDQADAQTAAIKLADLYIRFSCFKEADALLGRLQLAIFSKAQNYQVDDNAELKWHKLKWDYADRKHDLADAYRYSKQYFALRDSMAETNKGLINADMDEAFNHNEAQYKLSLLNADDRLKTVYLAAIVMVSLMGFTLLLFVLRNLKNSRKLNRQIIEQNRQMQNTLVALEQSQADNTRMMQIVAHDLRNPIGGMTSAAALMLEDHGRRKDDLEMLELIKTSGESALELVSDLLQVPAKTGELNKELVDLQRLLLDCVGLLQFKARDKGQRIELQAQPATIPVNREKIWRVVSNLIANAVKFSPAATQIVVRLEKIAPHVLITVEDQGIGIPVEMQDKIFDLFTDAKRPGTAGEQPFGMGLAISKQIIEAHEGIIWFESKEGKGTNFFVQLPAD